MAPKNDETKVAQEIISVLDPAALRACSPERDVIRYAVRTRSLKLRTIIFLRSALQRLLSSADSAVKIDYLKRDLLAAATTRVEYRYPHLTFAHAEEPEKKRVAI